MSGPHNIPSLAPGKATATTPDNSNISRPVDSPNQAHLSNDDSPTTAREPVMKQQAQRPPLPIDTMRAYRACLNCRNRKSKCDLDMNGGRPPCRRCTREGKDCILGESHRGGRRVRKKQKLEEMGAFDSSAPPEEPSFDSSTVHNSNYSPIPNVNHNQPQPFQNRYDSRPESSYSWEDHTISNPSASETAGISRTTDRMNITSPLSEQFRPRQESNSSLLNSANPVQQVSINRGLAPEGLQNPSDALEILAQVADRAEDGDSSTSDQHGVYQYKEPQPALRQASPPTRMDNFFQYGPAQSGMLSPEMIYQYFSSYEQFFHPYFPIIPRQTFNRERLPWLSHHEPYLFSAVLTIASKDDERVHQVCYDHMQGLITMVMAGADANVDAVEALLLLSQWVSHRPQASTAVGRGEEDRVAWMYIGTALRLAYFLGIDKTAFKGDSNDDAVNYNRKRLVWTACYICDRQVSVRLGKGFWARGPGPLSGLRASDFPTLQPRAHGEDNWAVIFQANLELTQIFSNVHDILYSSKDDGWTEMLKGRYAKYLDDFRTSIRIWNDTWSALMCSRQLKASLLLTYDYLRLYVNAFAYQATISRALIFQRDSQHRPNRTIPLIDASASDARFIYEALNAAKSLLSTFNGFVDPESLRYMPISYYLFVIYSAVFLYKARLTTTMSEEERTDVREMINLTIDRLQKASVDKSHMGSRYARLLQLLWRKSPPMEGNGEIPAQALDGRTMVSQTPNTSHGQFDANAFNSIQGLAFPPQPSQSNNAFSWLDLGATWNFATQNNSVTGGHDDSMIDPGLSPFGSSMNFLPDYSFIERENGNFIF